MDEKSGEREKIKTLAVIVVIAVVADIKMEIFMKKFICAVSIMTGVLLLPLYAQAKVDITEIDVTDEVVSEDTIYELNKQYREQGHKISRPAWNTNLWKCTRAYGNKRWICGLGL